MKSGFWYRPDFIMDERMIANNSLLPRGIRALFTAGTSFAKVGTVAASIVPLIAV